MKDKSKYVVLVLFLSLYSMLFLDAQQVRIMPLGNSITYDENSLDGSNPRPVGDRISYRYKLYQLLNAAGYDFDYVGSENSGNNYFQNTELDDNAGFPGITDDQMAYLINTGYNQFTGTWEAPGPYLTYYPADIILLHIGTNNLQASASDVENILDNIRNYDSDCYILVARIINRRTYSSLTTTFNNNVEYMVSQRNDPHIIMVNMENGAGINYSTEMADELHPKQSGFDKMGAKWFEAIIALNNPPVVSDIPDQSTEEGTAFPDLSLDNYVSDVEDTPSMIAWTARQRATSHLSVSIGVNRILHAYPTDSNWVGTDTLTLIAEDSGSRAFRKKDSTDVLFTVINGNDAPVITSLPVTQTDEDANYSYTLTATDIDGDLLYYSEVLKPAWLTFSTATHILSGKPTNNEVGTYTIILRVSDGSLYEEQEFQLTVNNVNDLPVITTHPDSTTIVGSSYMYQMMATDVDKNDTLTYSYVFKPEWLTFVAGSSNAILFGTSSNTDLGSHGIILKVSDGHEDVIQGYTLKVIEPTSAGDYTQDIVRSVYPNPADDRIYFRFSEPGTVSVEIFDITGCVYRIQSKPVDEILEINIADLSRGIYIYKLEMDGKTEIGKITKK